MQAQEGAVVERGAEDGLRGRCPDGPLHRRASDHSAGWWSWDWTAPERRTTSAAPSPVGAHPAPSSPWLRNRQRRTSAAPIPLPSTARTSTPRTLAVTSDTAHVPFAGIHPVPT